MLFSCARSVLLSELCFCFGHRVLSRLSALLAVLTPSCSSLLSSFLHWCSWGLIIQGLSVCLSVSLSVRPCARPPLSPALLFPLLLTYLFSCNAHTWPSLLQCAEGRATQTGHSLRGRAVGSWGSHSGLGLSCGAGQGAFLLGLVVWVVTEVRKFFLDTVISAELS